MKDFTLMRVFGGLITLIVGLTIAFSSFYSNRQKLLTEYNNLILHDKILKIELVREKGQITPTIFTKDRKVILRFEVKEDDILVGDSLVKEDEYVLQYRNGEFLKSYRMY
jgi:hypothetical protein